MISIVIATYIWGIGYKIDVNNQCDEGLEFCVVLTYSKTMFSLKFIVLFLINGHGR